MPRDLDGACLLADHAISGIRMKTKQSCDSSVPTTAPAAATECKHRWRRITPLAREQCKMCKAIRSDPPGLLGSETQICEAIAKVGLLFPPKDESLVSLP